MRDIDTAWFQEQAERCFGSTRKLAANIIGRSGKPLDPAALVRAFHGEREFTLAEIEQLAHLLRAPVLEVMRRAGVEFNSKPKKLKHPRR